MTQENPTQEELKDVYCLAIAARDFEITQLVQRNNFFMIFQGVLLAGLLQASNTSTGHITSVVAFLVCLAGLLISILQFFMASGAKFWQERWEHAVEAAEAKLFPNTAEHTDLFRMFSNPDPDSIVRNRMQGKCLGWLVTRSSPSGLPIYTALIFVVIWLLLWLSTFTFPCASFITGFPK
jgi:hypothetical protein